MFAVTAVSANPADPLAGLELGERPEPAVPDGWTVVTVKAASLNHHDVWTLRGVGVRPDRFPLVLGCDAAGLDPEGREVVVYGVIADPAAADETLDPGRSLLSEVYDGTLAERVAVPTRNLVPKPSTLSFEQAACLPTAWLTAYRMLFTRAGVRAGERVLVPGAGGGVGTALVSLARSAGLVVWATSREEWKRERIRALGAHDVFAPDERPPGKVDAVLDTVGAAVWESSLRALRPGGVLVTSGATSGFDPPARLNRIFFLQLSVVGSTMGTRRELERLLAMLDATGVRPVVDSVLPLSEARAGFSRMTAGALFGKVVFTV